MIDAHRRQVTAQQHQLREEHIQTRSGASGEEAFVQREILHRVLEELPERDVELLMLREGEGLSYDELAHELAIERGSVGTLLRRARQAFHKAYHELHPGNINDNT